MAKILIVDDDMIVKDALSIFLSNTGHKITTASDGLNAINLFKDEIPDLVILDRDLPLLTGSKVLLQMKELSKNTPIIILTGYDSEEDAKEYLSLGATTFLSKSIGLKNVLNKINEILGIKEIKNINKYKILIADDDEDIRNILKKFISSISLEPILAIDGFDAMEKFKKEELFLILLDINMPKIDGIELLKKFLEINSSIPVIMITGNNEEELARNCLKIGAFDYISKPINLKNLETIIKTKLLLKDF